jgi:phosphoheptose isomerase
MIQRLLSLIQASPRVYLCGNGGSAANADHIANDLIMAGIPAQSFTSNVAVLTMLANDVSYEQVFAQQVRTFGRPGELLIAGNSPNVVEAVKTARYHGLETVAIVGSFTPSPRLSECCHHMICFGATMQEAEEFQLRVGHQLMHDLMRRKQ